MGQAIPVHSESASSFDLNAYASIPEVLDRACRAYAERPAFTSFGRTLTYAELDRLSAAFAAYLQTHTDLQPGDRLAIQLPNMIQYPVVLFGALRAGLVVVNTNPLYNAAEMAHQFRDSGAKALVIYASMAHKAEEILDQTEIRYVFTTQVGDLHGLVKRVLLNSAVRYIKRMEPRYRLPMAQPLRKALDDGAGCAFTPVACRADQVAVLQYTGGTTGVAKGAMLTHGNLIANMQQVKERLSTLIDRPMTFIAPLPLYHIYAYTMHCMVLLDTGNHSVLIANPRDLPGLVKTLGQHPFDGFVGINTLFVALCEREDFRALDFSHLRVTSSGGMALTGTAAKRWQQVTGCEILEGYGLTETSPVVSINPPTANRLGTIGTPVQGTEIRLLDLQGQPVPRGEAGELCVRGPQVTPGYWGNTRESLNAFTEDGFFRTGDVAIEDSDGYLRIVDRRKDLIIVSGFNVYPNEVEEVACTHPDVVECAAIGVPDERSGEAVKLFAVRRGEALSEADLRAFCREKLTGYKVPRQIEFRDELPKSNVGKILRRELRDAAR